MTHKKIDKLNFIKIKTVALQKTVWKESKDKPPVVSYLNWLFTEDKPQIGKKYLQKTSDKGLLSKIYKELLKFNNRKTTQLKTGQIP